MLKNVATLLLIFAFSTYSFANDNRSIDNETETVYNEELFKHIEDDNVTDEESASEWRNRYYEDIFVFNETPMSTNIPSSFFFKARLIHNNPDKSEYEKKREFYYLTIDAIDAFYSYAVELSDGARDIENCEDEVEALLAFLQIINANEHGYKDLVQPETLIKIEETFILIDIVVKKQIERNMQGKKSLLSVYDYDIEEFDITYVEMQEFYPALYSLQMAKEIHQSDKSEYEKKREILQLLIVELPRINNQINDISKRSNIELDDEDIYQMRSALGFMQTIADNKHEYRELISGDDIELLNNLIYRCEVMLGLRVEVVEYLDIIM